MVVFGAYILYSSWEANVVGLMLFTCCCWASFLRSTSHVVNLYFCFLFGSSLTTMCVEEAQCVCLRLVTCFTGHSHHVATCMFSGT